MWLKSLWSSMEVTSTRAPAKEPAQEGKVFGPD